MRVNYFLLFYQYLIALPIFLVLTVFTAIFTLILYPIFPNKRIANRPAEWWSRLTCYLFFIRVELLGADKIDTSQSYVFISNHQSSFDIFAFYGWMPHVFKWVMKAELKKIPLVGSACQTAGHIFIDRSNPVAALESMQEAESKLVNGTSIVIFPEGTRTKTGKVGRFKKGAFRIAQDLSLSMVPITIKGSYERFPRGTYYIRPGKIQLIIHNPINPMEYADNMQELMQKSREIIEEELS